MIVSVVSGRSRKIYVHRTWQSKGHRDLTRVFQAEQWNGSWTGAGGKKVGTMVQTTWKISAVKVEKWDGNLVSAVPTALTFPLILVPEL